VPSALTIRSKLVAAVVALLVGAGLATVVAPPAGSQQGAPPKAVQVGGAATHHGDPSDTRLSEPVVAIAATSSGGGYWLTTSNGAVLAYGDAEHRGGAENIDLWEPINGMAPTPSGRGYWLVATDGGVFTYGDAQFHGSAGGIDLWAPIVGMAPTPSGRGYWLVASDGGIFTYGDAGFFGSAGALPLVAPVVGMAATPTGRGYWLVAADGGVFTFGDARFYGSGVEQHSEARSAVGIARLADGGYVVAGDDGSVLRFVAGAPPASATGPVAGFVGVAIAAHPTQVGWWVAGRAVVDQMTVSQPGGLRGGTTEAAFAAARSVGARATLLHGGALSVTGARRNGAPVVSVTPGWRLSYSVQALEPSENELFIGPHIASALAAGDVVVGARTAQRTGITVNDVIDFIGWDGRPRSRRVAAIGTPSEVGDTELTFSVADARSFGFVRPTAVRIWDFPSRQAIEAAAAQHVPAGQIGVDVTWRDSGRDAVLSTARLKEELGEFEFRPLGGDPIEQQASWRSANLVHVNLPILGPMTCHRRIVPDLVGALTEASRLGLAGTLDVGDTRRSGGCHNARLIRSLDGGDSGGSLSRHSWAAAIDVNPSSNPFGGTPRLDRRLVDVFRRWGFAWGGTWVRPDGMHLEWVGR
jgi:hypothetical protein